MVGTKQFQALKRLDGIHESFDRAKDLDIVVTSDSLWNDPHNKLRHYIEARYPESIPALKKAGCMGDMLWRPLGLRGPVVEDTEIRAMTLMELTDLQEFIARGKQVLLLLGPCAYPGCNIPKTEMLKAILGIKPPLATHLVVNSVTARKLFG